MCVLVAAIKDKQEDSDRPLNPKEVEAMESSLEKEKERQQRQAKVSWKQWFKRPSFYIVSLR